MINTKHKLYYNYDHSHSTKYHLQYINLFLNNKKIDKKFEKYVMRSNEWENGIEFNPILI